MPYLQLSLPCTEAQQPRVERALEDVGALAITLQDAHLDAADEQAIFEPGVGELPLWDEMTLTALFDADANPLALLAALDAFDPGLDWSRTRFETVEDQDWERAWLDTFQPMLFGERTWIVPWNHAMPDAAQASDAAIVHLDPGLAFGSGTHPTTALCLRWLDSLATRGELQGKAVLDFGCGSGILALAALRLGWAYCPEHVADTLNRIRGPFNVNRPAQYAGAAAARDIEFTQRLNRYNADWRGWLTRALHGNAIRVVPSQGNFILALFEDAATSAAAFEALMAEGLIVREMGVYDIPNGLRISIGPEAAMRRLVDVLKTFGAPGEH